MEENVINPAPKKVRKPAVRRAPKFQPYKSLPGEKELASPESQLQFHELFQSLSPAEIKGIAWYVKQLTTTFLPQGYRKMIRFSRRYMADQADVKF